MVGAFHPESEAHEMYDGIRNCKSAELQNGHVKSRMTSLLSPKQPFYFGLPSRSSLVWIKSSRVNPVHSPSAFRKMNFPSQRWDFQKVSRALQLLSLFHCAPLSFVIYLWMACNMLKFPLNQLGWICLPYIQYQVFLNVCILTLCPFLR